MNVNRRMSVRLVLALSLATWSYGLSPAATGGPRVKIVTQRGDIVVALNEKRAPKTVANFLRYVDAKFYDGGSFFRAVPGFVIQGGNRPRENPTDVKLALEPPASTGLRNRDRAISMARTSDPDSATSEFFICDGDQPALDGSPGNLGYAAFGHVISGMEVVPVEIFKIVRVR